MSGTPYCCCLHGDGCPECSRGEHLACHLHRSEHAIMALAVDAGESISAEVEELHRRVVNYQHALKEAARELDRRYDKGVATGQAKVDHLTAALLRMGDAYEVACVARMAAQNPGIDRERVRADVRRSRERLARVEV